MPLWDVTYKGQPLGDSAWKAHLEILRAYVDGKSPVQSEDRAHQEATIAIHADGRILYCRTCATTPTPVPPGTPFHWCEYRLTEYGKQYAAERLKPVTP